HLSFWSKPPLVPKRRVGGVASAAEDAKRPCAKVTTGAQLARINPLQDVRARASESEVLLVVARSTSSLARVASSRTAPAHRARSARQRAGLPSRAHPDRVLKGSSRVLFPEEGRGSS